MTITQQIIDHFGGKPPFKAKGWETHGNRWHRHTENGDLVFHDHGATPADDILWLWALEGELRAITIWIVPVSSGFRIYSRRSEDGIKLARMLTKQTYTTDRAALLAAMRAVWPEGETP